LRADARSGTPICGSADLRPAAPEDRQARRHQWLTCEDMSRTVSRALRRSSWFALVRCRAPTRRTCGWTPSTSRIVAGRLRSTRDGMTKDRVSALCRALDSTRRSTLRVETPFT